MRVMPFFELQIDLEAWRRRNNPDKAALVAERQHHRFAHSPRMDRIFKKRVQLFPLNQRLQPINQPSRNVRWKEFIDGVMKICDMNAYPKSSGALVNKATGAFKSSHVSGLVHSECRILEFFTSQKHKVPPVSYIGGPKLSCTSAWTVAV